MPCIGGQILLNEGGLTVRTFAERPKTTQQASSPKTTMPGRAHFEPSREVNSILHLQRTIGNQAVQRMLQTHAEKPINGLTDMASPRFDHDFSRIPIRSRAAGALPTKFAINKPGDQYEEEADRVAEQVMRMPEPRLHRACACGGGCPKCRTEQPGQEPERLQTKRVQSNHSGQIAAPSIVHEVLRSAGQSLDPTTRSFMESRFRHDFSSVRVHHDEQAAESARALHALAYTVGRDVVFGPGQYAPHTASGGRLLAHELTHLVQQGIATSGPPVAHARVQRFESHEHVQLGDTAAGPSAGFILLECHNRDLPQHASAVTTWPPTWQTYFATLQSDQQRALQRGLTYGEIVALTGDMYVDFQALNRAPLREVIDLIPRIHSATTTTQQFQAATGGRYLALAKENIGHFSNVPVGQRNRDIWRRNHIDAIAAARTGTGNVAWGLNASGDHFLTDAFSGGHLQPSGPCFMRKESPATCGRRCSTT